MNYETLKFWFGVGIYVSAFLLASTTFGVFYCTFKIDKQRARASSMSDMLVHKKADEAVKPASPANASPTLYVILGNTTYGYSADMLKTNVQLLDGFEQVDMPLTAKIIDGKLSISTTIVDKSNKIIAQIVDNQWRVNPNNSFQRNYDDNAVEVIDEQGDVALSVELTNADTVQIQGIFNSQTKDALVIASKLTGMRILAMDAQSIRNKEQLEGKSWKEIYHEYAQEIPKLFVYIGKGFLSKRVSDKELEAKKIVVNNREDKFSKYNSENIMNYLGEIIEAHYSKNGVIPDNETISKDVKLNEALSLPDGELTKIIDEEIRFFRIKEMMKNRNQGKKD